MNGAHIVSWGFVAVFFCAVLLLLILGILASQKKELMKIHRDRGRQEPPELTASYQQVRKVMFGVMTFGLLLVIVFIIWLAVSTFLPVTAFSKGPG